MYILSLTVQDPDSLPEVEIAREKPLPFKPSGNGFGGKAKGGRRGDDRRDNRRGDNRRSGRRDDFKKEIVAMIVLIKTDVTVRIIKNHAILQVKSKQALLFVTRAINKKKRFKMNRFFI